MKLREIINTINKEFNLYIDNIKLINNKGANIPDSILDMEIKKIEKSDYIDIYLC